MDLDFFASIFEYLFPIWISKDFISVSEIIESHSITKKRSKGDKFKGEKYSLLIIKQYSLMLFLSRTTG